MKLQGFFQKSTNLRQYLVHTGCWVNAGCSSYYPKGWPLRSTCPTLYSIDEETEAQSLEGTGLKSKGSSHLSSCPLASSKTAPANYLGNQQLQGPT